MKIEVGKFYKTRDGRKARIYAVDGEGNYPIHGAVDRFCKTWSIAGQLYWDTSGDDLIAEWKDEPLSVTFECEWDEARGIVVMCCDNKILKQFLGKKTTVTVVEKVEE